MAWEELREKSHDYAWHATAKDRPIAVADIMREDGADEEFINHVTSLMDLPKGLFVIWIFPHWPVLL